jgi:hypothetical protein
MKVYHIIRQQWGEITEQCKILNVENSDPTSIFVEFEETGYAGIDSYNEIIEVTKKLLTIPFDKE